MEQKTQKHQIIIIDGGESFGSDEIARKWLEECDWDLMEKMPSWKKWLADGLGDDFQVIRPSMPNTMNAKYIEWKIWFEKYFKHIADIPEGERSTVDRIIDKHIFTPSKLILVGHSLGATFLVKYLTEVGFPREIDALHLVSPVLDDSGLIGESLASFRISIARLPNLHTQAHHIHIWSSTDDTIVPYDHSVRYHVNIVGSVLHTLHDRGHFVGQSHFVELFQEILKLTH